MLKGIGGTEKRLVTSRTVEEAKGRIRQNLRVCLDGLRDHELTGVDAFFDSLTEALMASLTTSGVASMLADCWKGFVEMFLRQKVTLA